MAELERTPDGRLISYAQCGEDIVLLRAFADQQSGFWIDVGANHPTHDSVTKNFSVRGWTGMNIEPVDDLYQRLVIDRPNEINVCAGVSNVEGTMTFFRVDTNYGLSTFDETLGTKYLAQGMAVTQMPVPVLTLAQLCDQHHVPVPIDFLKIDAEGFEREVIEGHDFVRFPVRVLLAEVAVAGMTSPVELEQISALLSDRGMDLTMYDGLNAWYVRRDEDIHVKTALSYGVSPVKDWYHPAIYLDMLAERDARISELLHGTPARPPQGAVSQGLARFDTTDAALNDAATAWDAHDTKAVRSVSWLSLNQVNASTWGRYNGGAGPVNGLTALLPDDPQGLSGCTLVCGDLEGERLFFETVPGRVFRDVDGFDISSESLKRVRPTQFNFHPVVADCNVISLEPDKYDLVVIFHGAHHIRELDNLFSQAHDSLHRGGVLFMYEWIGPTYLQIPRRNAWIAKLLLLCMFRKSARTTHMGRVKGLHYIQDPPDSFDPSEACNSLVLRDAYLRYFEPVNEVLHGGLCYPMFEGIAQNMAQDQRATRLRIGLTIAIEKVLTRFGLVIPLFTATVGRRRDDIDRATPAG